MPTEFLHSKYDKGGGAALYDMWSHWMRSPLFAGGFIWAYMDEAVRRTWILSGGMEEVLSVCGATDSRDSSLAYGL